MKQIGETSITRLARAGGVKRIANIKVHKAEVNITLQYLIQDIIIKASYVAKFAGRVTIQLSDVRFVLDNILDTNMTIGDKAYKLCKSMPPKTTKNKQKRGEKAKKEIDFLETQSECFLIPGGTFDTIIREMSKDANIDEFRFSRDAMTLIHFFVESKLVSYFNTGRMMAMNNKRKTLYAKDIMLAKRIDV
jgi:histone H3/H4